MKYTIEGEPFPVATCTLDAGETIITQNGAMAWMSPNMKMETTAGGLGKMVERAFTGESLFQNKYTAEGSEGMIALSSSFPGSILAFDIQPGKEIIAQKEAFLATESGVSFAVEFQKDLGAGLFGGEGFIMQRFSGSGLALLEFDGFVKEYTLQEGEQMVLDTGYLAAMEASCKMEIKAVEGFTNVLFGGEGLFLTTVTGPGKIWVQTMPGMQLAGALLQYLPIKGKNKK